NRVLQQTQLQAMKNERLGALGEMASGIAHDINNSLSPAALFSRLLLERNEHLSPEAREYLTDIERSIQDVVHTVTRLRDFYRARETQLVAAPVQLNRVIEQVVDLTRARWHGVAQERGIIIHLEMTLEADLPQVLGVESEIRDALVNLILNAV